MFEETNQTEFDDLFADAPEEVETQAEPDATPTEEAAEQPQEETTPAAEPATFKVKHLGQEMELTQEQLIANAQKGMDYDRIRQERDALKNAPELQILDHYAKQNNMTRQEFVNFLKEQQMAQEVTTQVQRGIPEDVAKQLVELRRKEAERTQKEQAAQQEQAQRKQFADFVQEYPGVKEFPPEVKAAIESGETPLSAYRAWENRQLKAQLAAMEQAKKNATKAVGSVAGDAPPEAVDDFLAGFESEFK